MSLEKHIKDSFSSESDLSNEQWLELGDDFYGRIEDELFEEKEDRKFFWFWIVGGIALSVLLLAIYISSQRSEKENFSNIPHDIAIPVPEAPMIQESNSKANRLNGIGTDDFISSELIQDSNSSSFAQRDEDQSYNSSENTLESNSRMIENSVNFNELINNEVQSVLDRPEQVNVSEHDINFSMPKADKAYVKRAYLNDIPFMNLAKLKLNEYLEVPKVDNYYMPKVADSRIASISIQASRVLGQFKLNDNLKLALEPAAYVNSDLQGYQLGLNYEYPISPKWSVVGGANYSDLNFSSGHNSSVAYNITDETNMQNVIPLTMASPFGFVQSNITVERSPNIAESNLFISLYNEHRLQDVSITLGVLRELFDSKKWSACLSSDLEYIRTIHSDTNLDRFTIQENGYNPIASIVTQQAEINNNRWAYGLALRMEYQTSHRGSIGVNVRMQHQLTDLFSLQDFNVRIRSFQMGVVGRYRFIK